jgi:hypothetical protein
MIDPDGRLPDMSGFAIETPEALLFAEYVLIIEDLQIALQNIKALRSLLYPKEDVTRENRTVNEALFRDAIVQFGSCFDPRAKVRLNRDEVYIGDAKSIELFDHAINLRNSFVAHRFGTGRICFVNLIYVPRFGAWQIKPQPYRFSYEGRDGLLRYQKLILHAIKHTQTLSADLHRRVIDQVKAMTLEELYKLPVAEAFAPRGDDMWMTRKEYRRAVKARAQATEGQEPKKPQT